MKKLVVLLPVLSGVLWGSAGVFVRDLTEMGMDDYTLLSSRMIVAAAVVFLGICLYDQSLLKIRPKDLWIFLGGGVLGMLGLSFCYNIAISQLTLSLAAVLLSLSPVFVLLLSAVLFREKVTGRKVGCMAAALAGCALASGVLESASGMQWTVSGILIGLMGAFFYGLYSIFTKVAMERGYHSFTIILYCMAVVALVLLPFTDWEFLGRTVKEGGPAMWLFMLLHSLCTSVLPYVCYTLGLKFMDAGKASILAACEPVAAMVFGILFFREMPTALSLAGLCLTVLALIFLSMPEKERA